MPKYPIEALTNVTPQDLAWLVGMWKGQRGDDIIEEHWSIGGGAIMGMYRWQKGDSNWFYELMLIEAHEHGVELRLKHFYPGLKGWEEKDEAVTFLLVHLEAHKAIFWQTNKPNTPWLVYELETPDSLVAYFESEGEPPAPEHKFVYGRATHPR